MKILIPGSFDPPTNGHIDVIKRSSSVFDEVIVGVVVNPQKESMFDVNQRENMLMVIYLLWLRCNIFNRYLNHFWSSSSGHKE